PTADAFWPSKVEPWSQYLTGTQGGDPGYDPLAFAVAEAHKRNLELHGWFNPYRLSMGTNLNALIPTHPARLHPDWVVTYGGKLCAVRGRFPDAGRVATEQHQPVDPGDPAPDQGDQAVGEVRHLAVRRVA